LAALGALVAGCGGGDARSTAPVTSPARQFGTLRFSLSASRATYARAEPVQITFVVRNVGAAPVTIDFVGATYATQVTRGDDVIVTFPQLIGGSVGAHETIMPGQTVTIPDTWDQTVPATGAPAPPGAYTVNAWLPATAVDGAVLSPESARSGLAANSIAFTIDGQ
jgi:hypothetical protein